MTAKPWMPLYIADYLADTTHLMALESGAYLHLIMHYWQHGGLPDDDRKLGTIAKVTPAEWKRSKDTLRAFFQDGWKHKRIDAEMKGAEEIAASNSKKARTAAETRWSKHRSTHADDDAPSINQASAKQCPRMHTSQSQSQEERKKESWGADAPPISIEDMAYIGRVIRLSQDDHDRWRKAYPAIKDLRATLETADAYYSEKPPPNGKWFFPVSRWLEKENKRAAEEKRRESAWDPRL